MRVEAVTHKLVVFEQVDIEAEGEEELVLLKQRAAYIDVKRVCKMVLQNLESKYTESIGAEIKLLRSILKASEENIKEKLFVIDVH